jgi:hypothetical protein
MNNLDFGEDKKITINFADLQEIKFRMGDFDEEELTKIISQFNNGNLIEIRNIFVNPKNINYFKVDDLEEDL